MESFMQKRLRQSGYRPGFSLGEMLVALVIGAMVLTAILTVYGRMNDASDAVLRKIDSPALADEVFQSIQEDLDRILGTEPGVTIQIQNGSDNKYARAQLVIRRTLRDSKNQEQTFEEITWRAGYDYDSSFGLVIYRGHEGINSEDQFLDQRREAWEKNYPLVPICRGVTFFQIEVPRGEGFLDRWSDTALPPGVRVTISFAQPFETVRGTYDVDDAEKITRTIAIDKTRRIRFIASATGLGGTDPNSPAGGQTPAGINDGTASRSLGSTAGRTTTRPAPETSGQTNRTTYERTPSTTSRPSPTRRPR
jgi:prepilin-type N-terminal cleavage/methylation domain-containing protein